MWQWQEVQALPRAAGLKQIHVVAGVIRDPLGRILLARRTEGRDLAGLWEFPGGKVEPGESPETALQRELHEELGIRASIGAPLICVPQQYPDKRLVLDVRDVHAYDGAPKGLDGQALVWAPPHLLVSYSMPPADRPVVAALRQPDRYLITPEPGTDDNAWLMALQRALAAGIQRVQLRMRDCEPGRWQRLTTLAVGLCRESGAEVLVNGDIDTAARLGCGVHLRSDQLNGNWGQSRLSLAKGDSDPSFAASCHTQADLLRAEQLGCGFVVLGPVQATASHPDANGIGWEAFAQMREQVSLPIYALGGMQAADIPTARAHGAQGIAAIRGL